MSERTGIEYEWLTTVAEVEVETRDVRIKPTTTGDKHVVIEGFIAHDDTHEIADRVEQAGLPLLFTLAALSFGDAAPTGDSAEHGYREDDKLMADDLLRHLRYRSGELHVYIDYLRGRMVKTRIVVRPAGTFTVETVNRGEAAKHWLDLLQGRPPPPTVPPPPRVLN